MLEMPPDRRVLRELLRQRRFAVPASMVEQATERRRAGDWLGACAAARIAVDIDLDAAARRYGAEVAAAVEDDLRHLVPDLVRWHMATEHGFTPWGWYDNSTPLAGYS